MEELEFSNFTNVWEVLGMSPSLEVERAVGTMVALPGSTKPEGDMPSNCRKFYRKLKKIELEASSFIITNICALNIPRKCKKFFQKRETYIKNNNNNILGGYFNMVEKIQKDS